MTSQQNGVILQYVGSNLLNRIVLIVIKCIGDNSYGNESSRDDEGDGRF